MAIDVSRLAVSARAYQGASGVRGNRGPQRELFDGDGADGFDPNAASNTRQSRRPDVLPADDYGVRKGFSIAFNKCEPPTPKDVAAHGVKWAPYRTVASWYLWRASEE